MSEKLEKRVAAPEVLVQEQPKNNELTSALLKFIDVLEYTNKPNKIINKSFEKTAMIDQGRISISVNISNLPSKEFLNALDKLQEFSNTLMFKEIPDSITKS